MDETLQKICVRLHNNIYKKCGFKFKKTNGAPLTQTQPFEYEKMFNITKGVGIHTIKGAKEIVVAYMGHTDSGLLLRKEMIGNMVYGYITPKLQLPVFTIFLKDGRKINLVPQNPWSIHNKHYTNNAIRARYGYQISWIMNLGAEKHKWLGKIEDGKIIIF